MKLLFHLQQKVRQWEPTHYGDDENDGKFEPIDPQR